MEGNGLRVNMKKMKPMISGPRLGLLPDPNAMIPLHELSDGSWCEFH